MAYSDMIVGNVFVTKKKNTSTKLAAVLFESSSAYSCTALSLQRSVM